MDYIKQKGYEIENIEDFVKCKNSIVFDIDNKNKLLLINSNVLKLKEETIKDLFNILNKE